MVKCLELMFTRLLVKFVPFKNIQFLIRQQEFNIKNVSTESLKMAA